MEEIYVDGMTKEEAKQFQKLFSLFLESYKNKGKEVSDKEWLKERFIEELGIDDNEAEKMAEESVSAIKEYDDNLSDLRQSCKNGKSKEQWFANKVAEASTGMSVMQYGQYLNSLNETLTTANAQMQDVITTKFDAISRCKNLDGYIAEQHHVNTFNANAILARSKYRAMVKTPDGKRFGKNSVDIVIKDLTTGKENSVHQYQVKYGKNAIETIKMLREEGEVTRYSNQQIVVPPDQVAKVKEAFPGKTVVSRIGGTDKVSVTSSPLTKTEAKKLQLEAQEKGSVPSIDWNTFKTKELALQLGKNAGFMGLQSAMITTGFSLAEQALSGEKIDTDETVRLAISAGVDTGIKTVTTGALKVGVEKGLISVIPKGTSAGIIANIACVSIENVKILWRYANREITLSEALEMMGQTTTSMVFGLSFSAIGMTVGAAALSWIPLVGPVVGGLVGGTLGYMAGSKVGKGIYNSLKKVKEGAKSICRMVANGIKSFGFKILDSIFS